MHGQHVLIQSRHHTRFTLAGKGGRAGPGKQRAKPEHAETQLAGDAANGAHDQQNADEDDEYLTGDEDYADSDHEGPAKATAAVRARSSLISVSLIRLHVTHYIEQARARAEFRPACSVRQCSRNTIRS